MQIEKKDSPITMEVNKIKDKNKVKVLKGTSYVIPLDQKQVGRGAFGHVFRVYDLSRPDIDLAVKVVEKASVGVIQSARKEIKILENLPYCVNVLKYEKYCLESNKKYYFIMEYCEGGDLYTELYEKKRNFSEMEILDFLGQFVNGYMSLLKQGIVHRDIKPQNILIKKGIYKICDFGLGKQIEQTLSEKDLLSSILPGTPFYQAPDLHKSMNYSAQNLDVFSLGVILFLMLFDQPNYILASKQTNYSPSQQHVHPLIDLSKITSHKNLSETMGGLKNENVFEYLDAYILSSKVKRSPQIIEILKRMLNVDLKKRITFDELFIHPLISPTIQAIQSHFQNYVHSDPFQNDSLKEVTSDYYQEMNSSKIINIPLLQNKLQQAANKVCDSFSHILSNTNAAILDTYSIDKRAFYQMQGEECKNTELSSSIVQQPTVPIKVNDQNNIKSESKEDNKIQRLEEYSNIKKDNLLLTNLNKISKIDKISAPKDNEISNLNDLNNCIYDGQDKIIPIQIDPHNIQIQKCKKQYEPEKLESAIRQSMFRMRNDEVVKRIEEVVLFLREVCQFYKRIAKQLSESYGVVKNFTKHEKESLLKLFDEVCLLSLLFYRYQLGQLSIGYTALLRRRDLFQNDISQKQEENDSIGPFSEQEISLYNKSIERDVFQKLIQRDEMEIDQIIKEFSNKQEFLNLYNLYRNQITSQLEIKQNYTEKVQILLRLGVQEFAFLNSSEAVCFQKTLLFLLEVDQLLKNAPQYYHKLQFKRGQLQFRVEQIEQTHDIGSKLTSYCEKEGINLIVNLE